MKNANLPCLDTIVSIRAPAWDAMATHSKVRPFQAPFPPLRPQNRRNFGNPFPLTHPCVSSLREKTCQFYAHLGFALEFSFGFFRYSCVAVVKTSVVRAKRPCFGLPRRPTKRRVQPCQTINRITEPFLWLINKTSFTESVAHFRNNFSQKKKTKTTNQKPNLQPLSTTAQTVHPHQISFHTQQPNDAQAHPPSALLRNPQPPPTNFQK